MNEHSLICKFINSNPQNWEEILNDKYQINIKKEGDYAIFNYSRNCSFFEPIVQEARGIIIDLSSLTVVCRPFNKFGNYTEAYADEIDWDSARVQEKVDGSIIKLWYDFNKRGWQFSTNGVIRAENAPIDGVFGISFGDVISSADNYNDITFNNLNKNYTYIFELVSPETKVVVKYDKPSLYHIGTRDNDSGEEYEIDIGIKKPASYNLKSLNDCINAAIALNKNTRNENEIEREGFVVVDKNWHRIKVKSPDYLMMHRVTSTDSITKSEFIKILLFDRKRVDFICENCKNIIPAMKFYDYHLAELLKVAQDLDNLARKLYEEYDGDRKAVAKIICKHKLSSIGLKCIDLQKNGRDVVLETPPEQLSRWIPTYVPEDLSKLFIE